MDIKLIIPARYESTRFPGKPLANILGTSMIKRVFDQCSVAIDPSCIYVATDNDKIARYCKEEDIQVVLTAETCLTGTDRVAEAAEILGGDVFINVQGDEPIFNPEDISRLLAEVNVDPSKVYCGYTAIESEDDFRSRSLPKMVFNAEGKLLYTSRSEVPGNKKNEFKWGYRQVCAYAFPLSALRVFSGVTSKGPLENEEDLELLRFLELDYPVNMIEMSNSSIPVDHPEDVLKVESELNKRKDV
jgi:3-deoxy-manno-octulosonate cytidylyltransferase (CMP-KDO synthetase)